ncbi:Bacterial low temperature requirement A protein (LtrA) [Pseudovibrio axinellae]|uniref:Bacterial low temperature requirement A protein (LtrA) n=1 Tax=Pseudovibrio axinellae TaxID=989403 RepID=A0A161V2E0_9HYPH|nr:low temperature requirement protein A [Pseudovibrio axinellae]KZL05016.1 Bacterial low temperature requirement A protein (LtrA) [Pseudovibrio axinellae]SER64893.1 Low temperature requirement protein LtrA [Pseudovibrio axinellae]
MFSSLMQSPRLRAHTEDRHATWLELFFDLVLVAAIAQVAHLLVKANTLSEGAVYAGLFLLVFWVWCGHTIYSTRFDFGDPVFKVLTFFNMFTLIIMAVEVHNVAHGHAFTFALAYLSSRLLLLCLLGRAFYHVPQVRKGLKVYIVGFGIGTLIWASSLFFHAPHIYWIWAIAIGFELLVPWYIWRKGDADMQVSSEHIPERFGLFTIIVLGENIFAVVNGLKDLSWNSASVTVAVLSFVLAVAIWWSYFQRIEQASENLRLGSGQPYIYSHFPILLGIVAVGIGALRLIIESNDDSISLATLVILLGGYASWWLGITLLSLITRPQSARGGQLIIGNLFKLIILALIGLYGRDQSAIEVIGAICTLALISFVWQTREIWNYKKL